MFDAAQLMEDIYAAATPFPALDRAVHQFLRASRELQRVQRMKPMMQRHFNIPVLRRNIDNHRRDIEAAFASELLPKVMNGGTWVQIRAWVRMPYHSSLGGQLLVDCYSSLLQFPLEFRAVGRNGRPSQEFAVVARSFDIFDGDAVRRMHRMGALGLVQEFEHPHRPTTPLGVWAMRSAGDDDGLVIVGQNLEPDRASEFGMVPLAPCAH